MSSADEVDFVFSVEFVDDVASEEIAGTARAHTPPSLIIGITPHEVAHCAVVRYLLLSVNSLDLVKCIERRGETTMDTKYFVIDDCCERKEVKYFCAVSPDVD